MIVRQKGGLSCLGVFLTIILQVLTTSGCARTNHSNQQISSERERRSPQVANSVDPELAGLVKTFSEDVGPNGQAAWQKLQSYPRKELIDSISVLRASLDKDDHRQYSIAFLLCNLDYGYQSNVEKLVSPLRNTRPLNNNADTVVMMLDRLVRRGDKKLSKPLFEATPYADASIGEALSDVLADELRRDPREFLNQLKDEPRNIRLKVYEQIRSGGLTENDTKTLRAQLDLLSHEGPFSNVAREMLTSSIFKG